MVMEEPAEVAEGLWRRREEDGGGGGAGVEGEGCGREELGVAVEDGEGGVGGAGEGGGDVEALESAVAGDDGEGGDVHDGGCGEGVLTGEWHLLTLACEWRNSPGFRYG